MQMKRSHRDNEQWPSTCTLRRTCPALESETCAIVKSRVRENRRAHFNACKYETHLEKEQVRQTVRTSCGGFAKLWRLKNENAFPQI